MSMNELTPQQRNVLHLIATGKREAQVAEALNIRPKTVKFHKTGIYKILGVKSLAEATIYYQQLKAEEKYESFYSAEARKNSYVYLRDMFQAQAVELADLKIKFVESSTELAAAKEKITQLTANNLNNFLPKGRV